MLQRLRAARQNDKGFTLVELLIVIVILGVLAGIVVFAVNGITDRGEVAACKADVKTVQVASEAYNAKSRQLRGDRQCPGARLPPRPDAERKRGARRCQVLHHLHRGDRRRRPATAPRPAIRPADPGGWTGGPPPPAALPPRIDHCGQTRDLGMDVRPAIGPGIDGLLEVVWEAGATDLLLTAGAPPQMRLHGNLIPVPGHPPLSGRDTDELLAELLTEEQAASFDVHHEYDFSVGWRGQARVRGQHVQPARVHRGGAADHPPPDPDHGRARPARGDACPHPACTRV